jgi:hypothetical protein
MQDLKKKGSSLCKKKIEENKPKKTEGALGPCGWRKKPGQKNRRKKEGHSVGPRGWRKNRGQPKEKEVVRRSQGRGRLGLVSGSGME